MTIRSLVILVVACSGCVTTLRPGDALTDHHPPEPTTSDEQGSRPPPPPGSALVDPAFLDALGRQVEFEHGCPPSKVRLIRRSSAGAIYDLDVCGAVRRYESVSRGAWLDVTALFPASALPTPLPLIGSDAASSRAVSQTPAGSASTR